MEWSGEAIVLSARPHGDTAAIASLLTRAHGRHAGLVRGGVSRRARGTLQAGNRVVARWRGRLVDQLGALDCELGHSLAPAVLTDRLRLAAVVSACAITEEALPEREPFPELFAALDALLEGVETDGDWACAYVRWEAFLLGKLGYGLDLSRCALTGATDGLAFVSPRTGRAVTATAGAAWRERLLPLPAFLVEPASAASIADVASGLALTGSFLRRFVFGDRVQGLPAARGRLVQELARRSDGPVVTPTMPTDARS
ncbi:MAG: DNA repair protein RecO [Rhodospirillales bacterium]|nr:DNA repair protein RecO [Rhodospirillales bacterium]